MQYVSCQFWEGLENERKTREDGESHKTRIDTNKSIMFNEVWQFTLKKKSAMVLARIRLFQVRTFWDSEKCVQNCVSPEKTYDVDLFSSEPAATVAMF